MTGVLGAIITVLEELIAERDGNAESDLAGEGDETGSAENDLAGEADETGNAENEGVGEGNEEVDETGVDGIDAVDGRKREPTGHWS